MIRTGLVSITFRRLKPDAIATLVRQAGLDSIEWGGDVHVPHGDLACAAAVRQLTAAAGLAVSAYGSYYRLARSEADGLRFEQVVDTARALGAPLIRVWAGTLDAEQASAADWDAVAGAARRAATLADAAGLDVACEFHGGTLANSGPAARRLVELVAHPRFHTYWQPPNGREADACLESLRDVLPFVGNVHVFHWWPTAAERQPLAAGNARWTRYLALLRTTGRQHTASIEYVRGDDPGVFLEDAAALRAWCQG